MAQQVEGRHVEVNMIALLTLDDASLSTVDSFKKYVIMFAEHDVFEPFTDPFFSQGHGPDLFKREVPPLSLITAKVKTLLSYQLGSK